MKRNILYGILYILTIGLAACTDDLIGGEDEFVPKGESSLMATVEFKPLAAALAGKAKTAGNTIKSIENLCVLLYDLEGKLVKRHLLVSGQFSVQNENREGIQIAETSTPRAVFKLTIPYGRYYIYVAANMGDLGSYAEKIQTIDGLKSISFGWQSKVAENNQMFGHFTEEDEIHDEAPVLTVNKKNMRLHAWIRRVASKVTIAYDGTNLEEGVFIYIKSVQIRDIPARCFLGQKNTPVKTDELIREGETITYADPKNQPYDETWPVRVTKGKPKHGSDHSETADALFFYENMQGEGKSKRQDANEKGVIAYPNGNQEGADGYKDNKPYGTYIEVRAYYRSINENRLGNGDIVYRFMLGKDADKDYDAERNHHYKLTLKFNHFANDVDWHIDYEEEIPSIQVPEPYYISYLYNHSMLLPVKVNGGSHKVTGLSAKIDTNAWAPYNASSLDYWRNMDPEVTSSAPLNPWNGFLSLRRTTQTILDESKITSNEAYYKTTNRGERDYKEVTTGEYGSDTEDGRYYVVKEPEENTVTYRLPMYTRAKQMIVKTSYTGNNPYVAYQRKAVVTFTATLSNGQKIVKPATIMQVRRVVNPKGIWRKHDNKRPFHVVLKRLPMENATEFKTFTSEGAWKAYIVRGDKQTITLGKDTVKGSTGTPIDFQVYFNGCDEHESRCAVIRVEYHNYSCYHLIFARQGYAPMALIENGRKWHSFNMRTATREAEAPTEEGSLFKFGNWEQPIDATNNRNDKPVWVDVSEDDFKDHKDTPFLIAETGTTCLWSEIKSENHFGSFSDPTVNGKKVSVATYKDYNDLWSSDDIEQGFGVLYGDEATETLSKIEEVYGYQYDTNPKFGMRGVFVYNKSETSKEYGGRNVFFPLGVSGYGHRKDGKNENGKVAVLRYASGRRAPFPTPDNNPFFYDLYMRPGAIYWLKQKENNGRERDAIAWDFNYFTFDFNLITSTNIFTSNEKANTSDACFIRCVE